jgi:hypothetical protein
LNGTGKVKWIFGIILLVIIGLLILSKDAIMAAWAKFQASGAQTPTSQPDSPSVTTPVAKYPVCINSSPSAVMQAFIDSGYLQDAYTAIDAHTAVFVGTKDEFLHMLQSDPVGYLNSHPFLYAAYPNYFIVP